MYNYFPSKFYPSSSAYNYPAPVKSEADIFSNGRGTGVVHDDGTVGSYYEENSFGPATIEAAAGSRRTPASRSECHV